MRRAQRLAVVSLVAIIAGGVPFFLDDLHSDLPFPDFSGYYLAGAALNDGQLPYDIAAQRRISARAGTEADVSWSRFIYPPVVAAAMRPFALLPYGAAGFAWLGFSLAALALALYRLLALYRWPASTRPFLALLCALTPAALETLLLGQSNMFLLLAVVLALAYAGKARGAPSGAWTAVAAVLKLFPALFLVSICRSFPRVGRRALLGAFAVTGAAAMLAGLAFGGGREALRDWPGSIEPARRQLEQMPSNQSIFGVTRRLAQGGEFPARTIPGLTVTEVHIRSRLSPQTARAVAWTLVLAGVVPASVYAALRPPRRRPRRIDAGLRLSVLIGATLIVTPFVWDHYYVLLLVNALVVLRIARPGTSAWWLLLGGAHLVVLHRYWRLLLEPGGHGALSLGLAGTVLIWTASIVALSQWTRETSG
jgi:hypothetical protein